MEVLEYEQWRRRQRRKGEGTKEKRAKRTPAMADVSRGGVNDTDKIIRKKGNDKMIQMPLNIREIVAIPLMLVLLIFSMVCILLARNEGNEEDSEGRNLGNIYDKEEKG